MVASATAPASCSCVVHSSRKHRDKQKRFSFSKAVHVSCQAALFLFSKVVRMSDKITKRQLMTIRVTYSTSGYLHKNGGRIGRQCERSFGSIDIAKRAQFPEGCVSAFILVENGRHVYQAPFGWTFEEK